MFFLVKSEVYDAVGLSIFVLMTDALTRANAKYKRIEVGVRRLFTNACVFFQ